MCNFTAKSDRELNIHLENTHRFTRVSRQKFGFSDEERKMNGRCFQWNFSKCRYLDECKFSHEEIPTCHYDGRCTRDDCRFFHTKPKTDISNPFLYRRGLQNNPFQNQGRHMGGGQRGQLFRR